MPDRRGIVLISFCKGAFSLAKSPLLPHRGNSPEKSASQDKAFRSLRRAARALPLDPAIFREKLSKALDNQNTKRVLTPIQAGGAPHRKRSGILRRVGQMQYLREHDAHSGCLGRPFYAVFRGSRGQSEKSRRAFSAPGASPAQVRSHIH